ncbi:MAG: OsmC-like protein [Thermoplasmata archaeon]|jgi:uncharacterized OsmC-like protein|nr:OsmC-like protein [Thermoplasmata archaeon]
MDVETATAIPQSPVAVRVTMRGHTVVQDKPAINGGQDQGPMASELLLAAILGCQHSTFVKVAAKRRLAARIERLEGAMHFADGDIRKVEVEAHVSGATEGVDTALRLTEKTCTISRALKVPVEVTWKPA